MRMLPVFIVLLAVGCGSNPTAYKAATDKQGYSDKIIQDNLHLATFKGNSSTKKENAELFAKFRSIEVCHELNKPTHILVVKDKTYSEEVTQSTSPAPAYYYGASPYYSYGPAWGMPISTTATRTWTETKNFPIFDIYFECTDKSMDAGVSVSNLSSSQMEKLIKDVQGGTQVDDVLSDSPNVGVLEKADIIYMANGERITTVQDLYLASRRSLDKPFKVELFRNGVKKEVVVKFKDVSEKVMTAQAEIIKQGCAKDEIKGAEEKSPLCE